MAQTDPGEGSRPLQARLGRAAPDGVIAAISTVGIASGVYLLSRLMSWLIPSGLLGGMLLFFCGLLAGFIALPLILILVFFAITQKGAFSKTNQDSEVQAKEENFADTPTTAEGRQEQYDDVVREMLQHSGKAVPPHRFYSKGRFMGWVWTIPSSEYDRTEAIVNWPPATEGPKKIATRWWASLRGQTLYLAKSSSLQEHYQVPVLEVDLEGCQVEIVKEGLKSKSKWWRKCPLQVSHASRKVLHSETSFALFGEGSAAKEQWYVALRSASGEVSTVDSLKESYQRFSENVRSRAQELYPQVDGNSAAELSKSDLLEGKRSSSPTRQTVERQQRSWGRLFSKRRKVVESDGSQKRLGIQSGPSSRHASPTKKSKAGPGFLSPMELDSAWMGKNAVPEHLAVPIAAAQAGSGNAERDAASVDLGEVERSAQSVPAENENASDKAIEISKPSKSVHFPIKVDRSESSAGTPQKHPQTPTEPESARSVQQCQDEVENFKASDTHVPNTKSDGLLPIECAINMLLVRGAFDVLRSPSVNAALKAHIHKKLNELRFPSWLHGIEVHEIETGNSVPTIHNLRAMPFNGPSMWPQVVFDFEYEGEITIVIETKLDVRDGNAWSQLDKAINRLEGAEQGAPQAGLDSDSDAEIDPPGSIPTDNQSTDAKKPQARKGLLANILPLRQRVAQGIRQVAEVAADHVSRMQLKLRLDIRSLKGPMYACLPPPPGDRLWFSFVEPPKLVAAATPLVGGRLLKYSYQAGRVSQWVGSKMQSSIAKNMVFPSCSDIPISVLLGIDHPEMAIIPSTFPTSVAHEAGDKSEKSPQEQLKTLGTSGIGMPKAKAMPSDEIERAASLENQTIIDTSAESTRQSSTVPGKTTPDLGEQLGTDASKPSGTGETQKAEKKGFWGRKKSAKQMSPVKGLGKPQQKPSSLPVEGPKTEQPKFSGNKAQEKSSKTSKPASDSLKPNAEETTETLKPKRDDANAASSQIGKSGLASNTSPVVNASDQSQTAKQDDSGHLGENFRPATGKLQQVDSGGNGQHDGASALNLTDDGKDLKQPGKLLDSSEQPVEGNKGSTAGSADKQSKSNGEHTSTSDLYHEVRDSVTHVTEAAPAETSAQNIAQPSRSNKEDPSSSNKLQTRRDNYCPESSVTDDTSTLKSLNQKISAVPGTEFPEHFAAAKDLASKSSSSPSQANAKSVASHMEKDKVERSPRATITHGQASDSDELMPGNASSEQTSSSHPTSQVRESFDPLRAVRLHSDGSEKKSKIQRDSTGSAAADEQSRNPGHDDAKSEASEIRGASVESDSKPERKPLESGKCSKETAKSGKETSQDPLPKLEVNLPGDLADRDHLRSDLVEDELVGTPKDAETASESTPKSAGWASRWSGSRINSQWQAFKSKNPNTVQQGIKLAGAVENLRVQAQEQIKKAQEAKQRQHELRAAKSLEGKAGKSA